MKDDHPEGKAPWGTEDRHEGMAESGPRKMGLQVSRVIVPKYRQRVFFGKRRKENGAILRELCRQKEVDLEKGNA